MRRESVVEVAFGLPAQFSLARVVSAHTAGIAAGAATHYLVWDLQCRSPSRSVSPVRAPIFAGADIENLVFGFHFTGYHVVHGGDVSFGEVYDVDIVAQAGAVGCVIVVAENAEALRMPAAVWVMKGTRLLGTPRGSSPMSAEGCAPIGLKYRSAMP